MRRFLIIVAVFFFSQFNSNCQLKSIVGTVYKEISDIPMLREYKIEEGIAIDEDESGKISFILINNGLNKKIICSEYLRPQSRRILAIQEIGQLSKNSKVIMSRCRKAQKDNGYIIAIVETTQSAYFKKVKKAWIFNKVPQSFSEIPTKGIDCINDEFDNL
ncbi:hypothetical protein [Sediminibacterium sp. C3]|uniref:hypothetical protein n=1 Tax=Sediminibacterium sp. C3 TaxID=1267211 RepID=UPI00047E351A|nr:hypothetical protein [Sediminibacterium sp. C3]